MILTAATTVYFFFWKEAPGQIGVATGIGLNAHLLAMIPAEGCREGLHIYSGRNGEQEAAIKLIKSSKVCEK